MHKSLTLGVFLLGSTVVAQPCQITRDINAVWVPFSGDPVGVGGPGKTRPIGFVACGGAWYFMAANATGHALWKTDGTAAGTVMVANISKSSSPSGFTPELTCCGNRVFFAGHESNTGTELWVTDGTAAGTRMVKDILSGRNHSLPRSLVCMGGRVYFEARGVSGRELWRSDGTASGTVLVKDFDPTNGSPRHLVVNSANNLIYFVATTFNISGSELWKSDGTTAGTTLVKDIRPGTRGSDPTGLVNLGSKLLFVADDGVSGQELWSTDGTTFGTVRVKDIRPGPWGSRLNLFDAQVIGSELFFVADDQVSGAELWKTDGTAAGTVLYADIFPGPTGSEPRGLYAHGNAIYCSASYGGRQLYSVVGGVPTLVKAIASGGRSSDPSDFSSLGNRVVFQADDGIHGPELWVTDGTSAGTSLVRDIFAGSSGSAPAWMTRVSANQILFCAESETVGRELFVTDGTFAGTGIIKDCYPGGITPGSNPILAGNSSVADGKALFFFADDGIHGRELWKSDLTSGGTVLVKDSRPGPEGDFATPVCGRLGHRTVAAYSARGSAFWSQLWISDGTAAGTQSITSHGNRVQRPVFAGGKLFYRTFSSTGQVTLWVTDGRAVGPTALSTPSTMVDPWPLAELHGRLVFTAKSSAHGQELWISDGTIAGTQILMDIHAGSGDSEPKDAFLWRGRLLFSAYGGFGTGRELWVSDGTSVGTRLVRDIWSGPLSSLNSPMQFAASGDYVYFRANDGQRGAELWRTDLTALGTTLVQDVVPGFRSSNLRVISGANGGVFFSVPSASAVPVLWFSDGTSAGTARILDALVEHAVSASRGIFFGADRGNGNGNELYYSDGTVGGTRLVCDLFPGSDSSSPQSFGICDGKVFFVGTDRMGKELRVVTEPVATSQVVGAGCGGRYQSLESNNPVIGGALTLRGRDAPATGARILVVGVAAPPAAIPGFLGPGCLVFEDLTSAILLPQPPGTEWSSSIPLPLVPSLLGSMARVQSVYDPTPLSVSNAVQWRLGR